MFFLLILFQGLAQAEPSKLKFDAFGKVVSKYPEVKKGQPIHVTVQLSTPKENEDSVYIFQYSCIDKKERVFFSKKEVFEPLRKGHFRSNISKTIDQECINRSQEIVWDFFHTRQSLWKLQEKSCKMQSMK